MIHKLFFTITLLIGIIFLVGFLLDFNIQSINAQSISNKTIENSSIFNRGILTSFPVQGGHNEHAAIILPPRDDEASYSGILTFTASKPVEVILGHKLPIDNSTYSKIDSQVFGKLNLFNTTSATKASMISAPSFILPDYGSSTPHFSASMPFVASAVVLGSLTEPFVVVYEIAAEIYQPENIVKIESSNVTKNLSDTNQNTHN